MLCILASKIRIVNIFFMPFSRIFFFFLMGNKTIFHKVSKQASINMHYFKLCRNN